MVTGEDRVGQVVEPPATAVALVALPLGLGVVTPVPGNLGGVAPGASHAVRPAHGPDRLEALGVVDKGLDVDHCRAPQGARAILAVIRPEHRVYPENGPWGITTPESRMSLQRFLSQCQDVPSAGPER